MTRTPPSKSDLRLAEHYLRCAGVGAVCIEADGSATMYETVGVEAPAGVIVLCFMAADAGQIAGLARACRGHQAAVAEQLLQSAADHRIGLTPHATVVERAFAAVAKVETTVEEMQAAGGMKEINAAFKAARIERPSLRYSDYLGDRKAIMLEAIARRA